MHPEIPPALRIRDLVASDDLHALSDLVHRSYAPLVEKGWDAFRFHPGPDLGRDGPASGLRLVAEEKGQVVGTISLDAPDRASACPRMREDGVLILARFAVEPGLQGRGIGRALLDAAEARARTLGAHEVLGDIAEAATHLVEWYRQRGFAVLDTLVWPGTTYLSAILCKRLGSGSGPGDVSAPA